MQLAREEIEETKRGKIGRVKIAENKGPLSRTFACDGSRCPLFRSYVQNSSLAYTLLGWFQNSEILPPSKWNTLT